ncbi:MAG: LLM class flavin-dependent oxidoreductase [Chloroflexi bacterium]|nr:LLM class flavin-dependent oxidoreductase [Chloroflexota bacterium]
MPQISIAFQTNKTAQQYSTLAQQVNQYDFDVVSVYHDLPHHPSYAALLLMAPHISKARIGPAAVSPFRTHPLDIAAQAALLDQLAPGRTYIGMARGAWLEDHSVAVPAKPISAMREAVDLTLAILRGEAGYRGERYRLAEHVSAPYALPEQVPPLMIGTWGRKLCALAGEIAHEVKIGGSANPDVVPVIADYIAVGEAKAGRESGSVSVVVGAVTVVDEDREAARQAARRSVALYLPVVLPLDPTVQIDPELVERIRQQVEAGDRDGAAALISDDMLERFAFAGDRNDIIRQCEALYDAGAGRVELGTPHGLDQPKGIDLIGQQVVPALKAHWR